MSSRLLGESAEDANYVVQKQEGTTVRCGLLGELVGCACPVVENLEGATVNYKSSGELVGIQEGTTRAGFNRSTRGLHEKARKKHQYKIDKKKNK